MANEINGALIEIEGKIATLNKVAAGSEVAVKALSAGKTIIKQLPIPTMATRRPNRSDSQLQPA